MKTYSWVPLTIAALVVGLCSSAQQTVFPDAKIFQSKSDEIEDFDRRGKEFEVVDNDRSVPILGTRSEVVWVEVYADQIRGKKYLIVDWPALDEVVMYVDGEENSRYNNLSPVVSQLPVIRFDLPKNSRDGVVLSIKNGDKIQLPIYAMDGEEYSSFIRRHDMFFGLFAGILFIMLMYNAVIGFFTRDRAYWAIVFYIVAVFLTQASFQGYGLKFIWCAWPEFDRVSVFVLSLVVGISVMYFFNTFTRADETWRRIRVFFVVFACLYASILCLALIGEPQIAYNAVLGVTFCLALFLLYSGIFLMRRGNRQAVFYVVADSVVIAGVLLYIAKDAGLIDYNFFLERSIAIGSLIEVTLLSIALADRINILTAEKKRSQTRAMEVLRENERIVREQNALLEVKVQERTNELEKSNHDLNKAYNHLQTTQSQLVEAEKMAGLGQMTAGIAHELNNPINYVSSNVNPLERDMAEVFQVLDEYDGYAVQHSDDPGIVAIRKLETDLDLPFLRKEIDQLINGIREGAARSAAIVKGLRTFSRLDEDTLKKADINDGLESTLVILKSNYKGQCKMVKDLDPTLPQIECYPGKLNQVFMNILNNAIQATVSSGKAQEERVVSVKTGHKERQVIIQISDNGGGMTDETKARIFDPFFTTKKVGEGTGLGLSIVLGIIEQHNGEISVDSTLGKGTEFRITLPFESA